MILQNRSICINQDLGVYLSANNMVEKKEENGEIEQLFNAFHAAINLQTFEGSLVWSRFDAMLTTQTIFLALIGLLYDGDNSSKLYLLKKVLPILGLILCILWFFMTSRGYSWFKYWSYSVRELEDKIRKHNEDIVILKRGDLFRQGKVVKFDYEDYKNNKLQAFVYSRPWYSKGIVTDFAAYLTILIFFIIYSFFVYTGFQR